MARPTNPAADRSPSSRPSSTASSTSTTTNARTAPSPHHATPATIYTARPKATPAPPPGHPHRRSAIDRVDKSGKVTLRHDGRLHHIGIGRTHARTPVIMLIDDLDIRVIHAATGELLRHLTLDPTRDYQPQRENPEP